MMVLLGVTLVVVALAILLLAYLANKRTWAMPAYVFCAFASFLVLAVTCQAAGVAAQAEFIFKVVAALGVISAVAVALFKAEVLTITARVSLSVELVSPDNFENDGTHPLSNTPGKKINYHLRVRNLKTQHRVENCSVRLTRILDHKEDSNFVQAFAFAVPRLMTWAPADISPLERSFYHDEIFDLGVLFLSDGYFQLTYHKDQGGVFSGNCEFSKRRRYEFRVRATNYFGDEYFTFELEPRKVTPSENWKHGYRLEIAPILKTRSFSVNDSVK